MSKTAPKNSPAFRVITIVLLLVQALLLANLSWSTSPNRTEVGHIGAAVYIRHRGYLFSALVKRAIRAAIGKSRVQLRKRQPVDV